MRIKRFNGYDDGSEDRSRRYKLDLQKVYKKYKRYKRREYILNSILYMIVQGKGTIYLYSVTDDGDAWIKSNSISNTLHVIPVDALIDFDMKEWKLRKDAKKYNL